jgi:hypothetical protein
VNGPTSIFLTTAHPEALDYETRNRFVMLTADESNEQTKRILERQRWNDTLDGLVAKKKRDVVIRRHQTRSASSNRCTWSTRMRRRSRSLRAVSSSVVNRRSTSRSSK